MTSTVGLPHPGSTGAAFGAQLRARGHTVLWCPKGRSEATLLRAEAAAADAYGVGDELPAIAAKRTRSYLVETDDIPKTAARD